MAHVYLPELGEGINKAVIACWHFQLGDQVNLDDDIVEVVTDKAAFTIPSNTAGVVKEIKVQEGKEAKIGDILALIE